MSTPDPQHLDLDAIEKRRASSSEWLVHQPSNSIGWGSTAWVVDTDVPALLSRIRKLEAENAGLKRSWADVNAAIEETGSYKP
jgi:hypothetical protein